MNVVPEHTKEAVRRKAFKPLDALQQKKQGCYMSLADSRAHNAMWCPLGATGATAG